MYLELILLCFFFSFSAAAAAGTTWCQLAYWEECNRVGRLYPVSASTIEVFSALPKADAGLCLASLYKQNKKPSESTARTREKIGQGLFFF